MLSCLRRAAGAVSRWCGWGEEGAGVHTLLSRSDVTAPGTRYHSVEEAHRTLGEELTRGRRIVVIGDVHGCCAEVEDLLSKINFRRGEDIAVFVGDLLAKGPNSKGVIKLARELDAYGVRGNHDHYALLRERDDLFPEREHSKLARSILSEEDMAWLANLPLTLRIEEHKVTVVHAGLLPGIPRESNSLEDMLHMRNIFRDEDGELRGTSDPRVGKPWVDLWDGPDHVVFGHDAVRKLQRGELFTGLDSGCVYGGELSALLLPSREVISVKAREVYQAPGGNKQK